MVSQATGEDPQWKSVIETLVTRHAAEVLSYDRSVAEVLPVLRQRFPRYVCFVCQPNEATREFVADVNRLSRQLDDDPYTDALWGILTGYDAACALRIAKQSEPLEIHRVAAGTEVELSSCDEGLWYCELNQGKMVRKLRGQQPEQQTAPADTTQALVDALNDYQAQLFVTSGPCHRARLADRLSLSQRPVPFREGAALWSRHPGPAFPDPFRESQSLLAGGQLPDGPHRRAGCHGTGLSQQCRSLPDGRLHGADLVRLCRLGHAGLFRGAARPFHAWPKRSSPTSRRWCIGSRRTSRISSACENGVTAMVHCRSVAACGEPGRPELERCPRAALTTAIRWPSTAIPRGSPAWLPGRWLGSRI